MAVMSDTTQQGLLDSSTPTVVQECIAYGSISRVEELETWIRGAFGSVSFRITVMDGFAAPDPEWSLLVRYSFFSSLDQTLFGRSERWSPSSNFRVALLKLVREDKFDRLELNVTMCGHADPEDYVQVKVKDQSDELRTTMALLSTETTRVAALHRRETSKSDPLRAGHCLAEGVLGKHTSLPSFARIN